MKAVLSDPAAAALIVIDAAGGASMSEIARASGRSLTTIQRAIDRLTSGEVLRRTTPRGPIVFRPDAPKEALRELATWTLGRRRSRDLETQAADLQGTRASSVPKTVNSRAVRTYLPRAVESIVDRYDPQRVILFGSYARGTATSESDVDLLIVFDGQVDRHERQVEIGRLLRGAPFAKDVLVATSTDLPNAVRGTAIADAFHNGIVIYER